MLTQRTQSQQGGKGADLTRAPSPAMPKKSDELVTANKTHLLTPAHLLWVSTAKSILILVKIIMPLFTDQETEI